MGKRVAFRLNTVPVAQGRPRLTTIGGMSRAFEPKKSRDAKAYVADYAMRAMAKTGYSEMLAGPVECRIRFGFPCPKGDYRKRTSAPRRWHAKRPDLDNLVKLIMDACCDGIISVNDSNVVRIVADKIICRQEEAPFVSVLFQEVDEYDDSKHVW